MTDSFGALTKIYVTLTDLFGTTQRKNPLRSIGYGRVRLNKTVTSFGVPGFSVTQEERISMLVEAVGGLRRAAELAGVNPDTVNNWRKQGARVPLDGIYPLAVEAGVSLDWVKTGYQIREDLAPQVEVGMLGGDEVRLPALRHDSRLVDFTVGINWLEHALQLTPDTARLAVVEDDGMGPFIREGATVIVDTGASPPPSGPVLMVSDKLLARRLTWVASSARAVLTADAYGQWKLDGNAQSSDLPELYRIAWVGQPA